MDFHFYFVRLRLRKYAEKKRWPNKPQKYNAPSTRHTHTDLPCRIEKPFSARRFFVVLFFFVHFSSYFFDFGYVFVALQQRRSFCLHCIPRSQIKLPAKMNQSHRKIIIKFLSPSMQCLCLC